MNDSTVKIANERKFSILGGRSDFNKTKLAYNGINSSFLSVNNIDRFTDNASQFKGAISGRSRESGMSHMSKTSAMRENNTDLKNELRQMVDNKVHLIQVAFDRKVHDLKPFVLDQACHFIKQRTENITTLLTRSHHNIIR